jgi:hypothetical protein
MTMLSVLLTVSICRRKTTCKSFNSLDSRNNLFTNVVPMHVAYDRDAESHMVLGTGARRHGSELMNDCERDPHLGGLHCWYDMGSMGKRVIPRQSIKSISPLQQGIFPFLRDSYHRHSALTANMVPALLCTSQACSAETLMWHFRTVRECRKCRVLGSSTAGIKRRSCLPSWFSSSQTHHALVSAPHDLCSRTVLL